MHASSLCHKFELPSDPHLLIPSQEEGTASTLKISGYASRFEQVDLGGDRVRKGAFSQSLLRRETQALPMLFGHETKQPIGVWSRVFEDEIGLFVSGELLLGTARSNRIAHLIQAKAIGGLSIGYKTVRAIKSPSGRDLLELDLWEVSIVAFPMLRSARLTTIDE